jgi:hypothetical protein
MSLTTSIRRIARTHKLYPDRRRDRAAFWLAIFLLADMTVLRVFFEEPSFGPRWLTSWPMVIGLPLFFLVTVYILQEPQEDQFKGYTAAIVDIETISKQLSALIEFLKQERQRVAEAEATFQKLQSEKTELEPVILTQRQTVDAILSAHTKRTASRAWKERALGFISGLIASLAAAMVFELLRR